MLLMWFIYKNVPLASFSIYYCSYFNKKLYLSVAYVVLLRWFLGDLNRDFL